MYIVCDNHPLFRSLCGCRASRRALYFSRVIFAITFRGDPPQCTTVKCASRTINIASAMQNAGDYSFVMINTCDRVINNVSVYKYCICTSATTNLRGGGGGGREARDALNDCGAISRMRVNNRFCHEL